MTRWIAALAALAALTAAGLAGWQTVQLRRLAVLLASAEHDNAAQAAQLQAARLPTPAAAPPRSEDHGASSADEERRAQRKALRLAQINADPAVRAAVAKLVAFEHAEYLDPLLREAGLSEGGLQRAEFLLDQLLTFEAPYIGTLSLRTDPRPDADIRAELAQLLGPQGSDRLAAYQINRNLTSGLAGTLSSTGSPLTGEQRQKLTQILVAANQQPPMPGGWCDLAQTDWPTAVAQAGAVLSPGQLALFKDLAVSKFGADLQ